MNWVLKTDLNYKIQPSGELIQMKKGDQVSFIYLFFTGNEEWITVKYNDLSIDFNLTFFKAKFQKAGTATQDYEFRSI